MDIAEWLRGLGLGHYAPAFVENAVNWDVLSTLTVDDLKEIGVAAVGDRRRLLQAIAKLPAIETAISAPAPVTNAGAERRQLTVMFCDLVGSTALSGRLDPEDLRDVIGAYHRVVAEETERFGGFVAKYMGDGVLVYFGYPKAQEDDSERAVRAGLALIERVAALDTAARLQTRIGIATGLVVVGDLIGEGAAQERGVVGETPNLAARLQAMAEPNSLLIGETTRRLIGDLFECRDLGPVELRGIAEPVPAWQVLRPGAIESRFEALHASGLSPLVGREDELELLLRRWQRAAAGEGQLVLLSGEPGIGKSRLSVALVERLRDEPHIRLRYFCSAHHRDSALYPFVAQLERAAGFEHEDPPAVRLDKLEAVLAESGDNSSETAAALADLLAIRAEGRYPPLPGDPQRRRELILAALLRELEGLARRLPVLLLFEDAHWADSTSLELLDRTVERLSGLPVLAILTARPDFAPPWVGQANVTSLTLSRLSGRETGALAGTVAGKRLPAEILDRIVDRTDGIPLFVEELTKSLLESGLLREEADTYVLAGLLPPLAIPSSLRDSLMARLDRLAPVKEVAQIGAAIGREFSYELLAAVARRDDEELRSALGQLTEAGLVFRRGAPPRASYSFKHALVQDAAYSTLLRAQRQELHARIAKVLEHQFPETAETQPEILAQHFTEAGLVERAVNCWAIAGQTSVARSAHVEAVAQYQSALEQLALLPEDHERRQRELELRSALGGVLRPVKGNAAPETGENYARARELWEQLGSPANFLPFLYGQTQFHVYRGELDFALRLNEDLLRVSERYNDPIGLLLGHRVSAIALELAGLFASARSHSEASLLLCGSIADHTVVHQTGLHHEAIARAGLGLVLFCLGLPDQGLATSSAALAKAREVDHAPTLVACLAYRANLLTFAGGKVELKGSTEELFTVTTDRGYRHWHAQGIIYRGWSEVVNGDPTEGAARIQTGLRAYDSSGSRARLTFYLFLLASACEMAGQADEALTSLNNALQIAKQTGERWVEAELHRQKGQLLLRQGDAEAAEEFYRNAITIAREQEAKLWELRAATSLARLWGEEGRRAEAYDLLGPVYGWFTEGFDIADLREAKALLDDVA